MATGRIPTTANSPLTAKGDIFGYSTTQARIPVGTDGQVLTADSTASTGLSYQSNFAAGKNKIINGDFGVWQRGTSFNTASTGWNYTVDRWMAYTFSASTVTLSQQTFTPGTAPVSGYEGQYFMRINSTNTSAQVGTRIEDVRTLAGQTATLSFWAKSASGQTLSTLQLSQKFGSGGSADVDTNLTLPTLTTSWARYTATVSIPSVSGKTIGAGSNLQLTIAGAINNNLDIWGVQLEAGSTATAFQTATGTIQGELAACQRYYLQNNTGVQDVMIGAATSTTIGRFYISLPVQMRVVPTSLVTQNLSVQRNSSGAVYTGGTWAMPYATTQTAELSYTHGSAVFTAGDTLIFYGNNANSYYGINAEL